MNLIIAGTRDLILPPDFIDAAMAYYHIGRPHLVISGACGMDASKDQSKIADKEFFADGVDGYGEHWAYTNGIEFKRYPADWSKWGRPAGPRRNAEMANDADALLVIWDGKSPGSRGMKRLMNHLNKPVYEIILPRD